MGYIVVLRDWEIGEGMGRREEREEVRGIFDEVGL